MNSSDSEEDFESADEDIDVNNPSSIKTKEVIGTSIVTGNTENETNRPKSDSDEKSVEEKNYFEEDTECSERKLKSITESTSEEVTESKYAVLLKSKKPNVEQDIEKLVTKVANHSIVELKEVNSHTKIEPVRKNIRPKESKIKPTKLGMKLTAEVAKVEDDDLKNKGVKAENHLEHEKNISIPGDDIKVESTAKSSYTLVKSEEVNFEAGDGWEIEEENGFEIPVTIAKTGDDRIQCPQEHISELDQLEFRPLRAEQDQGWSGWGGWGVSSLLSSASGTVTTFSSHVTASLSTVLETTVGAPDPETLAVEQASHPTVEEEPKHTDGQAGPGYGGLGSIMSGVSLLGSSVINRGLDTLETIGKKTMEVLQEGDPGLKKKRAMLFQNEDKPILSQILREAKERADNSDKEKEEKEAARKIHFESLFDDFQGMVHLEALEMLSTQCELKLQSLLQSHSGTQLLDLQETLSQVRDLCEVGEEEEDCEVLTEEHFAEKVTICVEGLRIKIAPTKIIKVNNQICERLEQLGGAPSATVVNQLAISSLAELTAAAMECFHKSAELVMAKPIHNTADEADSYIQLTNHLCARISAVANDFSQLLTKNDPIANSSLITNIFLEASNSCSYIKNACQLLIPILQVGAVTS